MGMLLMGVGDIVAAAGGGGPVVATHRFAGHFDTAYGSGPATFDNIPISDGDKVVVFAFNDGNGSQNMTALTANSGAITFTKVGTGGPDPSDQLDIYYADTTGVTELDISVALSGSSQRTLIQVVTLTGAAAGGPVANAFSIITLTSSDPLDVDQGLAAPTDGVLLIALIYPEIAGTTWSGATELSDFAATSAAFPVAVQTSAANVTVTGHPGFFGMHVAGVTFAP